MESKQDIEREDLPVVVAGLGKLMTTPPEFFRRETLMQMIHRRIESAAWPPSH